MQEINYIDMQEYIKDGIKIVMVGNETCGVCVSLKEKLRLLTSKNQIEIRYIDYEKNREISSEYSILTIPIILLFIDGKEYIRESKYIKINEFEENIQRYINLLKGE